MHDPIGASRRWRVPFLFLAGVLTALGVRGVFWNPAGYTDALFEPDYTVRFVPEGGPLARAGFRAGDSILTVEGIPVAELGMYSRWPRSLARRPGESITMVVDRDGEEVTGEIVYGPRPTGVRNLQAGGLLVFLAFLWSGVWSVWGVASLPGGSGRADGSTWDRVGGHAMRMGALGLAAGLTVQWPDMGSWNGIRDHLHMAAMVLWALLFFRFFLFYPEPKRIAHTRWLTPLIFTPWVLFLGCLVLELIFHPRFYHSFGGFGGLLILVYLILGVAALIHSWIRMPAPAVRDSGLGFVLAGMGVGVAGVLLWAADALLLPGVRIPGSAWAPALFGVVPLGMALGIRRMALRE